MLTKAQEKLIRSLHRKKDRKEIGKCLVEGQKVIEAAKSAIEFTFSGQDTKDYQKLVTTESPQNLAAVARIPKWSMKDIEKKSMIVVLDGVQDPGNVGTILRLCLGFDASLLLVESADPTNPKVIRSSVGAMFSVPWLELSRDEAEHYLTEVSCPIYRLEKRKGSVDLKTVKSEKCLIIAGSEGSGIKLLAKGTSVHIEHSNQLESLNVANALAIALYAFHY